MSGRRRRMSAAAARELHYGPNMTPMVDVVMVILVFFMASSSVLGPEWFLRSSLPVVRPAPASDQPAAGPKKESRFEFVLRREGNATLVSGEGLDGAPFNSLRFRLEQLARDHRSEVLGVLVRPDPGVPYQELVQVHEMCQKLGIVKVGMLDREPAPREADVPTGDAPAPPK